MAKNNFLIFDENIVNMMSQSDYQTSLSRQSGVGTGIADSMLENKKSYQASLMAHALGELIASRGYDADDTSPVELVNNLVNSVTDIVAPEIGDYLYTARTINDPKWIKCQGQTLSGGDYPELASLFATSAPKVNISSWKKIDQYNPSWWDSDRFSWGSKKFANCSTNGNIMIQYNYSDTNTIGNHWGYGYSSSVNDAISSTQYYKQDGNVGNWDSSVVMFNGGLRGICYYTSGSGSISDRKGIFSGSLNNLVYEPTLYSNKNVVIDCVHDKFYGFLTFGNRSGGGNLRKLYFNTYNGAATKVNWGSIDLSNSVSSYELPMIANGQILYPELTNTTNMSIYKLSSDGAYTTEMVDCKVLYPSKARYDGKSYIFIGSNGVSYSNSSYITASSTFTKITDSTLTSIFSNAKAYLYESGYHIAIDTSNVAYLTKDFNNYTTVNLTVPSAGTISSPNFNGLIDTAGRQYGTTIISDNGRDGIYTANITIDANSFTIPTLGQEGVNVYIKAL